MTLSTARDRVARLPAAPGVYRFLDERGRALYLGRATNLRSRVASYWGDLRDRRHLRRMVPRIAGIEAVECASVPEATFLERNLLTRAKPYWNRARGGLEVPVYLRLDPHPTIVHTARPGDFGPYLGGTQARVAVAGLHRALPVAYTEAGVTGSERDLARARGIDPASGAALRERVEAVLRRDPAAASAVIAELTRHRESAAAALAFELAARVQEEIEAIEWLVAPQRVHRPGTGSYALHGWADGVAVTFEVHDGVLDRWRVRAAPASPPSPASLPSPASPPTPSDWADFATNAAALAARLR